MIEKIRAQLITIDLPTETSEPWIRVVLQRVIKDDNYNTVQTIDRFDSLHKRMSEIVADDIIFGTGMNNTLTGVDMQNIIRDFVRDWIMEKYTGLTLNEYGDLTRVIP